MQATPWQQPTVYVNIGPSKWWSWGLAIFLCISVFGTIVGTAIYAVIPYDTLLGGWDPEEPGEYPANGTEEEQAEWNRSEYEWNEYQSIKTMMDEMEDLKPQFVITGIVTIAAGIPAIFFLFQQDRRGYNFTFAWLGISVVTQVWLRLKMQDAMSGIYENMDAKEAAGLETWLSIQRGLEVAGVVICNTFLLMIIIMCYLKSQDSGHHEQSGFHLPNNHTQGEP